MFIIIIIILTLSFLLFVFLLSFYFFYYYLFCMGFHVLHIRGGGYLCHFWAQKIKSGLILERETFSL